MLKGRNVSLQGAMNFSKRWLNRSFSPFYHNNVRKWKKLKGKYKGQRVFLIGNGPSLNKTPLYLLKDEYTMSFNRFELMMERFCWNPTFFAMSDMTVIKDSQDIIKRTIDKVEYSFFLSGKEGGWKTEDSLPSRDNVLFFYFESEEFSNRLPSIRPGRTIAVDGLQILNYLGFDEICIMGVDMNYVIQKTADIYEATKTGGEKVQSIKDDDPNHFDPRYFGKGAKYTNPTESVMNNMLNSLQKISEWFKTKTNTKVYNIGYDSMVESFEKRDFMEVLNYSEEKIDKLFTEVIEKFGYASIDEFLGKAIVCSSSSEFDENKELISLPVDDGAAIVKKVILDYIPIGPYKGRIYFVKRQV